MTDDTASGAAGSGATAGDGDVPPADHVEPGVDPRLLEILVCPQTKAPLRYDRVHQELISDAAGLAFPIRDGIPIMLIDEARELGDGDRLRQR